MDVFEIIGISIIGLLVFIVEEFKNTPVVSGLTLILSTLSALLLSWIIRKYLKYFPFFEWCILGAFTAMVASILRLALIYGEYVENIQGVDCFTRLGTDHFTYLLFGVSGAFAGGLISIYNPKGFLLLLALLGISVGVLYHYKLAQGFWVSPLSLEGIVLLAAEFLGPSFYSLFLVFIGSRIGRDRIILVECTSDTCGTDGRQLLESQQITLLQTQLNGISTDLMLIPSFEDALMPDYELFMPRVLYEFAKNENLIMIHGLGSKYAWVGVQKISKIINSSEDRIANYRTLHEKIKEKGYEVKRFKSARYLGSVNLNRRWKKKMKSRWNGFWFSRITWIEMFRFKRALKKIGITKNRMINFQWTTGDSEINIYVKNDNEKFSGNIIDIVKISRRKYIIYSQIVYLIHVIDSGSMIDSGWDTLRSAPVFSMFWLDDFKKMLSKQLMMIEDMLMYPPNFSSMRAAIYAAHAMHHRLSLNSLGHIIIAIISILIWLLIF